MKSCFILSLVLSLTCTVFNVSGSYLLVEINAEMETIPRTIAKGKNHCFESFVHYFSLYAFITRQIYHITKIVLSGKLQNQTLTQRGPIPHPEFKSCDDLGVPCGCAGAKTIEEKAKCPCKWCGLWGGVTLPHLFCCMGCC